MIITNLIEELEKLKKEELISDNELAGIAGLSVTGLKKILKGETKRTQPATIKKIAEGLNREVKIEKDKITFLKKPDSQMSFYHPDKKLTHNENNNLTDLDEDINSARYLLSIPLLNDFPAGIDNWGDFIRQHTIDTIITHYQGSAMVFAIRMPDNGLGSEIKEGAIIVLDPDKPIQNGDIVALKHNNRLLVRHYYEKGDMITLTGHDIPPEFIRKDELKVKIRVLQSINFH